MKTVHGAEAYANKRYKGDSCCSDGGGGGGGGASAGGNAGAGGGGMDGAANSPKSAAGGGEGNSSPLHIKEEASPMESCLKVTGIMASERREVSMHKWNRFNLISTRA